MKKINYLLYDLKHKGGWLLDSTKVGKWNSKILQFGRTNFIKPWHDEKLHYHREGEEWYLVLNGSQKLQIGKDEVIIKKDQLLKVPEYIPHKLISYNYPFEGMTIRTPNVIEEKVILSDF